MEIKSADKIEINFQNIFLELLKETKCWADFKQKLNAREQELNANGNKQSLSGKIFEIFTKYYFLVDPRVKDDYKNVWLYNEIPNNVKEKLNVGSVEHGIDLVLEDAESNFLVVQCKFRSDETIKLSWSKDKISNLFGFVPNANGYIVYTNASELDQVSKTRVENFIFFNIHDLLEIMEETFVRMAETIVHKQIISVFKKHEPYDHQIEAINDCQNHFENHSRGQLILPCGAGKTLTALWLKERLTANSTLVLVPSLSLLRQIKKDWAIHKNEPYKYICVCSEKDIDSEEQDSIVMHTYEIEKVTTDPEKIKSFLFQNENIVIFSTYQSLDKIVAAIKDEDFIFDLVISDEAHRTAVMKGSTFSLIHENNMIPAHKRLYMTATPRVVSSKIKKDWKKNLNTFMICQMLIYLGKKYIE